MTFDKNKRALELFKQYPDENIFYIASNGVAFKEGAKLTAYGYGSKHKVEITEVKKNDTIEKVITPKVTPKRKTKNK